MKQTFRIVTLGCKSNQADSAIMAGKLISGGYFPAETDRCADVCVVNTCTVTNKSDAQSRQAIRKIIRENPKAQIFVTGCYAHDVSAKDLFNHVNISIIPVDKLEHITKYIMGFGHSIHKKLESPMEQNCDEPPAVYTDRKRAFYKIQDGCDNRCTYCAVWKARGPSRSKSESEVIQAIQNIERSGFREVVLTGIHIGAWGKDFAIPSSLTYLIEKILIATNYLRIRISSIEVNEIDDGLIQLMGSSERLCRHLHVPLQSGSDAVLSSMGRKYKSDFYFRRLQEIADAVPLCCIGADVIAGFPGETEDDHRCTLNLILESPLTYLHAFSFSAKNNTDAANMKDQVSGQLKSRRVKDLRALSQDMYVNFIKKNIGNVVNVVPDNSLGIDMIVDVISDNYIRFSLTNVTEHQADPRRIIFSDDNARSAIEKASKSEHKIGRAEDPTTDVSQ